MERTSGFTPTLGFHVLAPLYDPVESLTTHELAFKRAMLEQAAIEAGHQDCLRVGTIVHPALCRRALLRRARCTAFLAIPLLDGFDHTRGNVAPIGAALALR